jgi:hypothetical protein
MKTVTLKEQEENEQYLRFEVDLAGGAPDEDVPF